jgi:hypothetical protein
MAVSVRTRFEVFKRDDFTCQYCGKKSPEVVLEVDHIVPRAVGGGDDLVNLRTSCWACNSGKSDKPLSEIVTGEDPHDRAVLLLEQERQLREYNEVLRIINERVEREIDQLVALWPRKLHPSDVGWLRNALSYYPFEAIRRAMLIAIDANKMAGLGYVNGTLKRQKARGEF